MGDNCTIKNSKIICYAPCSVKFGNNVSLTHNVVIDCYKEGRIELGNDVIMGPNVYITNHNHGIEKGELIRKQTYIGEKYDNRERCLDWSKRFNYGRSKDWRWCSSNKRCSC